MMVGFYFLNLSPWPIVLSITSLSLVMETVLTLVNSKSDFFFSFMSCFITATLWGRDFYRESLFLGESGMDLKLSIRLSMALFIVSEIFFFFSVFWGFFTWEMMSMLEKGFFWPPVGVEPIVPLMVPTMNTMLLLSSGVCVTAAHHYIMMGCHKKTMSLLDMSLALGVVFSTIQVEEYLGSSFNFNDSVYSSIFYFGTGFHGCHVILGVILLLFMLARLTNGHFSIGSFTGFELSSWYWHFVDVVWLLLYITVYFS